MIEELIDRKNLLEIAEMEKEIFHNTAFSIKQLEEMKKIERYKFFIIKIEEKVAGYVILYDSVDVLEIMKIAVNKEHRGAWTACSTTPPRRARWPMPTTPMTARQSRPHRRMYRPTQPNPRSRPMRRTPRRNPDRISLPLKWIPDMLRVCFGGIFITNRNLTFFKIMVLVML